MFLVSMWFINDNFCGSGVRQKFQRLTKFIASNGISSLLRTKTHAYIRSVGFRWTWL